MYLGTSPGRDAKFYVSIYTYTHIDTHMYNLHRAVLYGAQMFV